MAKTISLKYPAACAECGTSLEVGARARWYGRGRVYGIGCHPGLSSDRRVRAARCEDAPCCGCCGPQGDGDYYYGMGDR